MADIKLRQAVSSDAGLIFDWVNEEECRANSFHTEPVSWDKHVKWFHQLLQASDRWLFIMERDGIPLGQIRLETYKAIHRQCREECGTEYRISYSIAREKRGKKLGEVILRLVEQEMTLYISGGIVLVGEVKKQNIASQKTFEKLGYEKEEAEDYFVYKKYCNYYSPGRK